MFNLGLGKQNKDYNTIEELVENFELSKYNGAAAKFDEDKLLKINLSILQNMDFREIHNMLEKYFGEYKWNKVGYSLVPFGAGAMEHATNIHIGVAFIDGTLNY